MPSYFVRVEAVNLANFIEDTQDLSTARGGGLLLLEFPSALPAALAQGKIHTGASSGIFRVELPENHDMEGYCEEIRSHLAAGAREDATFVVNWCPDSGDLAHDQALLTTRNRWRQMQSPAVVLPAPGDGPCEVDKIRPSVKPLLWKGAAYADDPEDREKNVSASVDTRREYGVDQKINFYKKHVKNLRYDEFTTDLEQIADFPDARKLHGKIALIYLDGNGFGGIRQACADKSALRGWSELMDTNQDAFLTWLLSIVPGGPESEWTWSGNVISNSGARFRKQNAFRIETLLWGGDEILWVVPAWTGWWVLQSFFRLYGRLGDSRTEFDPDGKGKRTLTHSASVVFCHHNAPVHRIRKLAEGLTYTPKHLMRNAPSGSPNAVRRNYCAYQALESFDHLGGDPGSVRAALMAPLGAGADALLIHGEDMSVLYDSIAILKQSLAKSRLHDVLARIYRSGNAGSPEKRAAAIREGLKAGEKAISRADPDPKVAKDQFDKICAVSAPTAVGSTPELREAVAWLHLGELWDYITPVTWAEPPSGRNNP